MERDKTHKYHKLLYRTATVTVAAALTSHTLTAQNPPAPIPPFSVCSQNVNTLSLLPPLPGGTPNPAEDGDTQFENALIDATESSLLRAVPTASSMDLASQVQLLGKLFIYDKTLSPFGNIACATCHAPYAGFTGGTSIFNATTAAQPGGVPILNATAPGPNVRYGPRKPQSYAYASFAPILHYNTAVADFYGGNFWDMRATGIRLSNPAAEQAQGPPVNPVEMGNPDTACVVWKASQGGYASLVQLVGGAQSFAINWPANVATVCATPGPPPANDPFPVHLSAQDRGTSNATYDHLTLAVASYEASAEVSPFSSKFDAWLAGNAVLSASEQRGYDLFNGKAKCNQCHLSGNAVNSTGLAAADLAPLFTDFTSANTGVPKNMAIPYYCESKADQYGYTANPQGFASVDLGVGAMLSGANNPNPSQWKALAPLYNGKFQVPTLRNVDMRPRPDFVKAYMHNGYLKSLAEVVHFYNTSQSLPPCAQGSPGEKVSCWPAPETPANVTTLIGNLGLSTQDESDIVAFLQTLSDRFVTMPSASLGSQPEVAATAKYRKPN
ncbi:MAG: Cytochrome c peroxidase family protein [Candidatus Solibacter sp.]|nr:Cytochrome c peroxidase family protein [Candidatus Solibacter sp.]